MSTTPRLVQVRRHILKRNDEAARALHLRFHEAGVLSSASFPVLVRAKRRCGKTDLYGPFNAIRPETYPHVQESFCLFVQLTGG